MRRLDWLSPADRCRDCSGVSIATLERSWPSHSTGATITAGSLLLKVWHPLGRPEMLRCRHRLAGGLFQPGRASESLDGRSTYRCSYIDILYLSGGRTGTQRTRGDGIRAITIIQHIPCPLQKGLDSPVKYMVKSAWKHRYIHHLAPRRTQQQTNFLAVGGADGPARSHSRRIGACW